MKYQGFMNASKNLNFSRKKAVAVLFGIMILAACGKDKKVAEEIQGTWLESKIAGVAVDPTYADVFTFGPCKNKKKEFCECSHADGDSGELYEYNFEIDDKGETLVLKSGILYVSVTIVELSADKLVLDWGELIEYTKI